MSRINEKLGLKAAGARRRPRAVDTDVTKALRAVGQEVMRARSSHGKFASAHEGYSVILEELDELWCEVKRKQSTRDVKKLRAEAVQVAAMAVRFLTDVGPED